MPQNTTSRWTYELTEALRKHWKAGESAMQIGKALGVTKNAVVGKAHRIGLKARPSPIKRAARPPVRHGLEGENLLELSPIPPLPQRTPSGDSPCLWPIGHPGEADFSYCAKGAVPGKPYCFKHCEKAYIGWSKTHASRAA